MSADAQPRQSDSARFSRRRHDLVALLAEGPVTVRAAANALNETTFRYVDRHLRQMVKNGEATRSLVNDEYVYSLETWTIWRCPTCKSLSGQHGRCRNAFSAPCQENRTQKEAVKVAPIRTATRPVGPTIPCDEAAIKRAVGAAMDAIVESNDVILDGDEPMVDAWALVLAKRAIGAGFRAAQETP